MPRKGLPVGPPASLCGRMSKRGCRPGSLTSASPIRSLTAWCDSLTGSRLSTRKPDVKMLPGAARMLVGCAGGSAIQARNSQTTTRSLAELLGKRRATGYSSDGTEFDRPSLSPGRLGRPMWSVRSANITHAPYQGPTTGRRMCDGLSDEWYTVCSATRHESVVP